MAQSKRTNVTELFDSFNETSRRWLALRRGRGQDHLGTRGELTAARSLPDVVAAYQDWGMRHLEMIGGETKRLLDKTRRN